MDVNITDIATTTTPPQKKENTIRRYEIGRVNQTEANV